MAMDSLQEVYVNSPSPTVSSAPIFAEDPITTSKAESTVIVGSCFGEPVIVSVPEEGALYVVPYIAPLSASKVTSNSGIDTGVVPSFNVKLRPISYSSPASNSSAISGVNITQLSRVTDE